MYLCVVRSLSVGCIYVGVCCVCMFICLNVWECVFIMCVRACVVYVYVCMYVRVYIVCEYMCVCFVC